MKIRLDPADNHWGCLSNPDKTAREIDDWWENNSRCGDRRATIDIRLPEVNQGGTAKIRWWSNDWFAIGLEKSADGKTFERLWKRVGHRYTDKTYEIELDPNCEFYRIHFEDGDLARERTRVHKDVEVFIAAVAPTPTPTPTPTLVPTLSICEWLKEVKTKNLTRNHYLWIYYLSQGWHTAARLMLEKISPPPPNLATGDQTLDNALGIYYYFNDWKGLGNKKTGCEM